jgi:hypothetical protein
LEVNEGATTATSVLNKTIKDAISELKFKVAIRHRGEGVKRLHLVLPTMRDWSIRRRRMHFSLVSQTLFLSDIGYRLVKVTVTGQGWRRYIKVKIIRGTGV